MDLNLEFNIKNLIIGLTLIIVFYLVFFKDNSSKNNTIVETTTDEKNTTNTTIEKVQNTEDKITGSKITVYNYNTSWCKYSVMFAPEWSKFETLVESLPNITAIDVKCDDEANKEICDKSGVSGFPSVVIMKDNTKIDYSGPRNAEAILEFINNL